MKHRRSNVRLRDVPAVIVLASLREKVQRQVWRRKAVKVEQPGLLKAGEMIVKELRKLGVKL